jgi:hypothetical protein
MRAQITVGGDDDPTINCALDILKKIAGMESVV